MVAADLIGEVEEVAVAAEATAGEDSPEEDTPGVPPVPLVDASMPSRAMYMT